MDIIKEFQQHPKAWSAFEKWCSEGNTMLNWDKMKGDTLDEREIRCLLADLQAWLRSVSIHANVRLDYHDGIMYIGEIIADTGAIHEDYTHEYDFDEALFAAISKGLEIFENSKTK